MEAHPHRIVHLLIPIFFKLLLSWGITPVGGYYFSSSSLSDSVIHSTGAPRGGDDSQRNKAEWDGIGEGVDKISGLTSILEVLHSRVFHTVRLHISSGAVNG